MRSTGTFSEGLDSQRSAQFGSSMPPVQSAPWASHSHLASAADVRATET